MHYTEFEDRRDHVATLMSRPCCNCDIVLEDLLCLGLRSSYPLDLCSGLILHNLDGCQQDS